MQNIIRIVAAVVDTTRLTLYKENGETVVIPQGDPRVRRIVDSSTAMLLDQGWADVDITAEAVTNSYQDFEEKSSGAVKFFRIAKSKLLGLFAKKVEDEPAEIVAPKTIGTVPFDKASEKMMSAVSEIMQHATPVSSEAFTEDGLHKQGNIVEDNGSTISENAEEAESDTIVAVVGDKVIPGMEKIKTQFGRAAKLGSTVGVENFLKRLGAVIDQHKHSVEDLLKFMERGDLPIADDGSILIYKVLASVHAKAGKFVDCHTKKVEQFVGAYVCMDPSLVDHDRRNECSNGLHVARRGYVGQFRGDVCVLAKLAPEDVIAVPEYDANKMRVCGYHIIAQLSDEEYQLLNQNHPITDCATGKVKLGMAIWGNHISRTHEVRITAHNGGGVVTTPLIKGTAQAKVEVPVTEAAPAAEATALNNPGKETVDVPLDPKQVVESVQQTKELSRKEQAQNLYEAWQNATEYAKKAALEKALLDFKKGCKTSWEKLGIDPGEALTKSVNVTERAPAGQPAPKAKATKKIDFEPKAEGSPRERIQKLLSVGLTSVGVGQAVLKLKKQSKKSWEALGVSEEQAAIINQLVNKG